MFRNADCEDGGDPLHPKDSDNDRSGLQKPQNASQVTVTPLLAL